MKRLGAPGCGSGAIFVAAYVTYVCSLTGKERAIEELAAPGGRTAQHPEVFGCEQDRGDPAVKIRTGTNRLGVDRCGSPRRPFAGVEAYLKPDEIDVEEVIFIVGLRQIFASGEQFNPFQCFG